jgi:hypothetical protein
MLIRKSVGKDTAIIFRKRDKISIMRIDPQEFLYKSSKQQIWLQDIQVQYLSWDVANISVSVVMILSIWTDRSMCARYKLMNWILYMYK